MKPSSPLPPPPPLSSPHHHPPRQPRDGAAHHVGVEHLSITAIIIKIPIHIHNIYIPPTSSCPPTYSPSITRLFQARDDTLILGDFNVHHPAWYSQTCDIRAERWRYIIHDTLTDSNLLLLNTNSPTRLPSDANLNYPDLSISTQHMAIDSQWSTMTTLNSDHPMIIVVCYWTSYIYINLSRWRVSHVGWLWAEYGP